MTASKLDLSGRTNGAGERFYLAGVEYVWVVNDQGVLESQRWLNDDGIPRFPEIESLAKVLLGSDTDD